MGVGVSVFAQEKKLTTENVYAGRRMARRRLDDVYLYFWLPFWPRHEMIASRMSNDDGR